MRVKKMRGLLAITTFLIMESLCFAAIEPDVTVVVVEPNDPNWTPSNCFVPAWEKVTLSTKLSNPDEVSTASGYNSTQNLSISFNFYKADIRNLISSTDHLYTTEAKAVDDQNNVYTYEAPSTSLLIDTTPSYSIAPDRPAHVSINFPMDPNAGYPVRLSQVSLSFNGLFAHAIRTVKIPFQTSDQWIEILPDYSILIEQAVIEEGKFNYRIKAKYEGPDSRPSGHTRSNKPIPQYIDLGMTFLNENGVNVRSSSGSGGFSSGGSGSDSDYTFSGSGSCDACGSVTTIQFKFAVDSYVDQMSYMLNDIPVPTF